jgi:cyclic pyranopterin phosphate synthase
MMDSFTHFDRQGAAIMVDAGGKAATVRRAAARGKISMSASCFAAVQQGVMGKGDVLGAARIAGIMAVKQTPFLIPLCHTIPIEQAALEFRLLDDEPAIQATCRVKTTGVTGAEMEALTGVTTALLTIYDMCKALDKGMVISQVYLLEKTGGKSGDYRRETTGNDRNETGEITG